MPRAKVLNTLLLLAGATGLAAIGSAGHAGATGLSGITSAAQTSSAAPHPPALHIVTPAQAGVAPGLLITDPIDPAKKPTAWTGGPTIYDNAGHVVWYKPSNSIHVTEPVTYQGKPALAYYQRTKRFSGFEAGYWVILDQSYQKVAEIHAGNGLEADHHELVLTDHDTALIDCYRPVTMDLSQYGGSATATVEEAVVQEVSLTTGDVVFEWHSLDHVPVTDTYDSLAQDSVDYFHINSIAEDTDGNLIISGRRISTILKIDHSTGEVLWRLGGRHSDFSFVGDGAPSFQHDVRVVGPSTYSAFDNGVLRDPPSSRGVTWQLDLASHTASVVDQWRHSPDLFASIMGSNRLLPNGNRLIGWAVAGGTTTEYAGHSVVFESTFSNSASSYRVFRSVWNATPATPPALKVKRAGGTVQADVSWNGATDMVRWELLAGRDASHLHVVKTLPYAGYQATLSTPAASSKRVFAVRAVRANGMTTQTSPIITLR